MKLLLPSLAAAVVLAPSVRAEEATPAPATPAAAPPAPAAAPSAPAAAPSASAAPETPATAQPAPEVAPAPEQPPAAVVTVAAPVDPAKNLLHAELATGAIGGVGLAAFSLGYERMVLDTLSVRVGFGVTGGQRDSFGLGGGERHRIRGFGGFAMVNGLFGDTHKLEVGLGVGYGASTRETRDANYVVTERDSEWLSPQVALAYRYQPAEGGFFCRVGAVWSLNWGTPLGLGAGWAF